MLQEYVFRFAPIVILVLFLLLIPIKLLLLRNVKANNKEGLFLGSFFMLGNRPTTIASKQLFYKQSNTVNGIVYGLIALVVAFYVLMQSIR